MIDMLKIRNKKLEEEIQSMHGKMARSHYDGHDNKSFVSRQPDRGSENLKAGFEQQKANYERARSELDHISQQLFEERKKVANLEVQLRHAEARAAEARDLQNQVDELKGEKRMLEARIKDLTSSPFFKDMDGAHPARMKEMQDQMFDSKKKFDEMREQYSTYEKQLIELKAQLRSVTEERDKFREDKIRYETLVHEKDKNQAFFGEQMKMFNVKSFETNLISRFLPTETRTISSRPSEASCSRAMNPLGSALNSSRDIRKSTPLMVQQSSKNLTVSRSKRAN